MNVNPVSNIAIMGGTFDPVHYGHLAAAETVRAQFQLQQVLFMPAGRPAHKKDHAVTDPEMRFQMLQLATGSNPYFSVSRLEIERPGATYTVDTLDCLTKKFKQANLYFITGADGVHELLTWKDPARLLKMCQFIAVTRPGFDKQGLLQEIEALTKQFAASFQLLEVPGVAISSSDIRNRVKNQMPIKYLVPESVEAFLFRHHLYQ